MTLKLKEWISKVTQALITQEYGVTVNTSIIDAATFHVYRVGKVMHVDGAFHVNGNVTWTHLITILNAPTAKYSVQSSCSAYGATQGAEVYIDAGENLVKANVPTAGWWKFNMAYIVN